MVQRLFVAFLVVAACAARSEAQVDQWFNVPKLDTSGNPAGSPALSRHAIVPIGGTAYSFGGATAYRYSPLVNSWATAGAMPAPIAATYLTAAGCNGKAYVFGGTINYGSRDVYEFDPVTGWNVLAGALFTPRFHAVAAASGSRIYIIGGETTPTSNSYLWTVEMLDVSTTPPVVTALPVISQYSWGAGAAVVGNYLFFFGGSDNSGPGTTRCVRLDLKNIAAGWTVVAPMPDNPTGFATFTIQSEIFIAGGDWQGMQWSDQVYEFQCTPTPANPNGQWLTRASTPFYRSEATGFALNGAGYVHGGGLLNGFIVNGMSRYVPDLGTAPQDPTGLSMTDVNGSALSQGATVGGTIVLNGSVIDPDPQDFTGMEVNVYDSNTGNLAGTFFGPLVVSGVPASVTVGGLPDGSYRWTARGIDVCGNHNPGGEISFGTSNVSFVIDQTAPQVPSTLSPVNQDIYVMSVGGGTVNFAWTPSADASPVRYDVLVMLGSAFGPVVAQATGVASPQTSLYLPTLQSSQSYFWAVRATDIVGNASAWSSVAPFRVFHLDGIDNGAGDATKACGMSADGSSSFGLVILLVVLLARRR